MALAADLGRSRRTPKCMTEFRGRPVVDRATARTLGTIVDVFVDASGARIVAVEAAYAGRAGRVRIPAEWITHIGSCAVMVARPSGGDLGEALRSTQHCLNCQSLAGLEVHDQSGDRVGYLQDAGVDVARLAITRFEFVPNGWRHWLKGRSESDRMRSPPAAVTSCLSEANT